MTEFARLIANTGLCNVPMTVRAASPDWGSEFRRLFHGGKCDRPGVTTASVPWHRPLRDEEPTACAIRRFSGIVGTTRKNPSMPPIVVLALGALAAGALIHRAVKEMRRINSELDRVKEGRAIDRDGLSEKATPAKASR